MVIKKQPPGDVKASEITPKKSYLTRRQVIAGALAAASPVVTGFAFKKLLYPHPAVRQSQPFAVPVVTPAASDPPWKTSEKPNSYEEITSYNNFYEFGTDKSDPAAEAYRLKTRPWTSRSPSISTCS